MADTPIERGVCFVTGHKRNKANKRIRRELLQASNTYIQGHLFWSDVSDSGTIQRIDARRSVIVTCTVRLNISHRLEYADGVRDRPLINFPGGGAVYGESITLLTRFALCVLHSI